MLKFRADLKTVIYMMLILSTFIGLWNYGSLLWTESRIGFIFIYFLYLYLSIAVSVIIHNHTHVQTWKNTLLNRLTDYWLTVFYGFPVFVWYPTHHMNHHVHVNKEPDVTRTYMKSEKNNLFTLLTYPSLSGGAQQPPIFRYLRETYKKDKQKFIFQLSQIFVLIGWISTFVLIDWKMAMLYVIVPQQVSLATVLIFNYLQHVHADEEDKYNSSRNFASPLTNFMLFNNGLHTVHHLKPALHWSLAPEEHAKIVSKIKPHLNQQTILGFIIKTYIIGIFYKPFRTKSMRLERMHSL